MLDLRTCYYLSLYIHSIFERAIIICCIYKKIALRWTIEIVCCFHRHFIICLTVGEKHKLTKTNINRSIVTNILPPSHHYHNTMPRYKYKHISNPVFGFDSPFLLIQNWSMPSLYTVHRCHINFSKYEGRSYFWVLYLFHCTNIFLHRYAVCFEAKMLSTSHWAKIQNLLKFHIVIFWALLYLPRCAGTG